MLRVALSSFVGLLLAAVLSALPAAAGHPKKAFPDAPGSWGSLGPVMLLAEAAEVELSSTPPGRITEPSKSSPDRIYVQDCRDWAGVALEALTPELQSVGFTVTGGTVLSVGQLIDPGYPCYALEFWKRDHRRRVGDLAPAAAPYFVHSVLRSRAEAEREWDALVHALWTADPGGKPVHAAVPACPTLREALQSDVAVVLIGQGRRVPFNVSMAAGLAGEVLQARGSSGPFSFSAGVTGEESSSSRILIAVVDLAGGGLIWADESITGDSLSGRKNHRELMKYFAGRMRR